MTFIASYEPETNEWISSDEYVLQAKFMVFGDVMTIIIDLEPDVDGGDGIFDDAYILADRQPYNPDYDFMATLYRQ